MFLFVQMDTNVAWEFSEDCEVLEDRWRVRQGSLDIPFKIGSRCFEVPSVPEDFAQGKYCYTPQNGWTPNPNFDAGTPTAAVEELEQHAVDLEYRLVLLELGGDGNAV